MNRHPGGEEQTLHLLKSIELKKGMKALDLGGKCSILSFLGKRKSLSRNSCKSEG